MTARAVSQLTSDAALDHIALTDSCQRTALAHGLDIAENEVLAIQHLARAGEMSPSQLRHQLKLSARRASCVIDRLEQAGYVTRGPHSREGRSVLLRLTPTSKQLARDARAPLLARLDTIARDLSPTSRETIASFLDAVGRAAAEHADALATDASSWRRYTEAVPRPQRWA